MADVKEVSFPISNSVNIKVGKGLYIDEDGVLNVRLAVAGNTLAEPGIAIFSANQFTVNANGMAQIKFATSTTAGIAYFDSTCFSVASNGRVTGRTASTTNRGIVQLATDAEVAAGTDNYKVISVAALAKRLKEFKPESAASKPTTLIGGGDTNEYPLTNGGTGTIAVWDAQNHSWIPSTILQQILAILDNIGSRDRNVALMIADKINIRSYNHVPSSIDNGVRTGS